MAAGSASNSALAPAIFPVWLSITQPPETDNQCAGRVKGPAIGIGRRYSARGFRLDCEPGHLL
jgi:hypothetical protein